MHAENSLQHFGSLYHALRHNFSSLLYASFKSKVMQYRKVVSSVFSSFILTFVSLVSKAQEKSTEINIDINKEGNHSWYTSPWVWIIGAIVFILLLLALLRGTERRG
jgi:formate hydrogenlyase subunit 4